MRGKIILFSIALSVLAVSCKKDTVPQQDDYYFTFTVNMSNKINEPTIINGYYGHVLQFEGNFMPTTDGPAKTPDTVRNELYVYEAALIDSLEQAKVQKDGKDFYDLRKLEKKDIKPKFIIKPNKSGFYQIDTNSKEYLLLIKVTKRLGYYNGGPLKIGGNTGLLMNLDPRIDFEATF